MILQLNLYLKTYCPLPDTVCTYRKNLPTEHAILKLLDAIYKNMDKQCVTLVTAIDLSAIFDMVNHSLLLKVVNQMYSFKGTVLKCLSPIYVIAKSVYKSTIVYLKN